MKRLFDYLLVVCVVFLALIVASFAHAGPKVGFGASSGGGGGGTPGGSDTQVQFNDAGSFGGSSAFTFNKASGLLTSTVTASTLAYSIGNNSGIGPGRSVGWGMAFFYSSTPYAAFGDISLNEPHFHVSRGSGMTWSSNGVGVFSSPDTGIARNAAGVVEINTGRNGTYGDLKLRQLNGASAGFLQSYGGGWAFGGGSQSGVITDAGIALNGGAQIRFSAGDPSWQTIDTGLCRNAAGVVEVNTGTCNAYGDLRARTTISSGYTVSGLSSITPVTGMRAHVTDAVTCTFMGALTGSGSTVCPVFYNGSTWVGG